MNIISAEGAVETSEGFDPAWYAAEYPDVAILGMDPATHYHWIGRRLGRRGAPSVPVCNAQGHEVADVAPPSIIGEGSPVSLILDRNWYRDKYLKAACDKPPLEHYEATGAALGYDPNPYFDVKWYLTKYPDVAAAGVNPVEHYLRFGAAEGRNPSRRFDTRFYAMQLDRAESLGGDLLVHFLEHGRSEGRLPDASAIRKDLSDHSIGANLSIEPTTITIGIVAYKQDISETINLVRSVDTAIATCGPNVSASVVIFDNGLTIAENVLPGHVRLMSNGRNDGFGRAHNRVMEEAFNSGSDLYLGVNPDGTLHRDCLKNMIRMSQRHGGNALIDAIQFPEEHPKFYNPETMECDWISGACFLITQEIWKSTEGFDENIFLYCEDVDLSWSARRHGYKTLTCPSALFYHDVTDRGYSERTWREMLVAGRYLAHKWQNGAFRERMENELLSEKFFRNKRELPKLNDRDVLQTGIQYANFQKMFSFTTTRW